MKTTRKIKLYGGDTITVPKSWIIINPKQAKNCQYVHVLACSRADMGIPYFLYFNNADIVNEEERRNIYPVIVKKWSRFTDVLLEQFKAEWIEYLPPEERLKVPVIEFFEIYDEDEIAATRELVPNYIPPYNVFVKKRKRRFPFSGTGK